MTKTQINAYPRVSCSHSEAAVREIRPFLQMKMLQSTDLQKNCSAKHVAVYYRDLLIEL
jgi:hypothetical protein